MPDIKIYGFEDDGQKLIFDIANPRYIGGITELSQWVLKLMLDSSEETLSPAVTGNLPKLASEVQAFDEFKVEVTEMIKSIEEFIKQEQQGKVDDPNRRLDELSLINVERGASKDHIKVRFQVSNEAGERLGVALPVKE